jgi:hypothetical protein
MKAGKRQTLGSFGDAKVAADVLWEYKRSGRVVVPTGLAKPIESGVPASQASAHASQAASQTTESTEATETAISVLTSMLDSLPIHGTPEDSRATLIAQMRAMPAMSMQELDDLMVETGTPGYLFTGEEAISIPLAQPGPSGESSVLISAAQQVEYNAWLLEKFERDSASAQQAESDSATRQAQED